MTLSELDKEGSIKAFLSNAPRYKIVIARSRDAFENLPSLNVGNELAEFIRADELVDLKQQTREYLNKLIADNTQVDPDFGKYICLNNIGILFEPELGFNVTEILSRLSKNTLILLLLPGELKYPYLYFLQAGSPHKINLNQITYTLI